MTDHDDTLTPDGASRRDFLKKSALATGAVWAAPTIMNLGPRAFGATASFPNTERDCLTAGGSLYRFYWEGSFSSAAQDLGGYGNGVCDDDPIDGFDGATPLSGAGFNEIDAGMLVTAQLVNGSLVITLPSGCELLGYNAKAGSAQSTGGQECASATGDDGVNNSFTITHPNGKAVSNVIGVICCRTV